MPLRLSERRCLGKLYHPKKSDNLLAALKLAGKMARNGQATPDPDPFIGGAQQAGDMERQGTLVE